MSDCYGPSKDGPKRREPEPDMYAEPDHATLRGLVKAEPEWAVNRLVADREKVAALEAELERQKETTVWTLDRAEQAEAEVKRLNDICDRLAATGRSHD